MKLYNTQQLLFSRTQKVSHLKTSQFKIPLEFYTRGFVVINDILSPKDSQETAEIFLSSVDTKLLPLLEQIQDRVQLAKADAIPICSDSVETSFQALHFDMGQPLISKENQLMISAIALTLTILLRMRLKPEFCP